MVKDISTLVEDGQGSTKRLKVMLLVESDNPPRISERGGRNKKQTAPTPLLTIVASTVPDGKDLTNLYGTYRHSLRDGSQFQMSVRKLDLSQKDMLPAKACRKPKYVGVKGLGDALASVGALPTPLANGAAAASSNLDAQPMG